MSFRKITVYDEVWEYNIGKAYINIRSVGGARVNISKLFFLQESLGYPNHNHAYYYCEICSDSHEREKDPHGLFVSFAESIYPSDIRNYILKHLI